MYSHIYVWVYVCVRVSLCVCLLSSNKLNLTGYMDYCMSWITLGKTVLLLLRDQETGYAPKIWV